MGQVIYNPGGGGVGVTKAIIESNTLTFVNDWAYFGDAAPRSGAMAIDLTGAIQFGQSILRYNHTVTPFPIAGVDLIGDDNFQPSVDLQIMFWHINGTVRAQYISPKYLATNPIAVNITLSGDFAVNGDIDFSYDYFGGIEGVTTFQLYESATGLPGSWTAIAGLNQETGNTLLAAQETKYIRGGVVAKSTLPASGIEMFSPAYGPIAAAPFHPDQITGALGMLHLYESDSLVNFTDDGGSPIRYVSSLDSNQYTAYHYESTGGFDPVLIREVPGSVDGQIDFDINESNQVRVAAVNPLPVVANDPRTVAFRHYIPAALGTGAMYMVYRDNTNYILLQTEQIKINMGGTTLSSPVQANLVDDDWHNIIVRSDTTNGTQIFLDGVQIFTDASHHFSFDLSASAYGRVLALGNALNLRGSLRILDYFDSWLDNTTVANLNTWMDQF